MPYSIKGNCVYKGDKVLECYNNHDDALDYLHALQANEDDSIHEMSLFISKSTISDGEMRWSAVNSDTLKDLYGEKMTLELFQGMLYKIKSKLPPPPAFADLVTSDYWKGGMPYLSIAHYSDANGAAVPGDVKSLYVDGIQLKAKGSLYNNPLGLAVWKSLKLDEQKDKNAEDRIRISIAFLDLAHKHGDNGAVFKRNSLHDICPECKKGIGDKVYLDGYLVHLALTTVPVNPRTIMESEDIMARKSKPNTKKEDAIAVLGGDEALAGEIEKAALETKSDILVEMSDAEDSVPVAVKSDEMNEVEWKPYGGATTLADAQAFSEAQQESWRVSDLYYTFTSVASNIMGSDTVEDKAGALSDLVDEFKAGLVAKSLYEELTLIQSGELEENYMPIKKSEIQDYLKSIVEESMAKSKDTAMEDEEASGKKKDKAMDEKSAVAVVAEEVAPAPVAEKSALEKSVDTLYNTINEVITKSGTSDEKLQAIQPSLEAVGNEIVAVIKSASNDPAPVPASPSDSILEAINNLAASVEKRFSDMNVEIATMKAQTAPINTQQNRVPVPRSLQAEVVTKSAPTQEVKSNSVTSIVRRSVGLS